MNHPLSSVHRLNLKEEPQEQLILDDTGQVKLDVYPNQIVTIGLIFTG